MAMTVLLTVLGGCAANQEPAPAASPSKSPEVKAPGLHMLKLADRDYLVHAPPSFKEGGRYPVVLIFHGNPSTPSAVMSTSGFNSIADEHGFLAVYPGKRGRWSADVDSDFIKRLLDHLIKDWGADPARAYIGGFSAGAEFSYYLTRDLPGKFAAIGAVSGAAADIVVAQPIPMITFQGGQDATFAPVFEKANRQWREAAQCGPEKVVAETRMSTCAKGKEHVIHAYASMGHEWPATAGKLMWEFFDRFGR